MDERRFAIYFVPPAESDLYRFGAAFLGYDCYSGAELGCPADVGLAAPEWTQLTREPRRYGFHATLKAPFRLLPSCSEADLTAELHRFSGLPRTPSVIAPTIRLLAGFIAIVPGQPTSDLDRLAADCVTAFDRFRRPLTVRERSKRLAAGLSASQIAHLDRWGYPFVFDDFRFHMTLTGPVGVDRRGAMLTLLQAGLERSHGRHALPIAQLALVRQDDPATPFRVVCAAELNAAR